MPPYEPLVSGLFSREKVVNNGATVNDDNTPV
jgi:hypothetical protein